jgi:hypothetical protein
MDNEMQKTGGEVKQYPTVKSIPPNTLFRLAKTGTVYLKLADGSIRNVEKAMRKLNKGMKKKEEKKGEDTTTK